MARFVVKFDSSHQFCEVLDREFLLRLPEHPDLARRLGSLPEAP